MYVCMNILYKKKGSDSFNQIVNYEQREYNIQLPVYITMHNLYFDYFILQYYFS